jgi:hypothetical protein
METEAARTILFFWRRRRVTSWNLAKKMAAHGPNTTLVKSMM